VWSFHVLLVSVWV